MITKNFIISVTLFIALFLYSNASFALDKNKKSDTAVKTVLYKDSLRNAFELAKELSRITNIKKPSDDERKRYSILLGKIFWYANLQDEEGNLSSRLVATTEKKYPVLHDLVTKIIKSTSPIDTFFRNEGNTEKWIKEKNVISNEKIKNDLQNFLDLYFKAKNQYTLATGELIKHPDTNIILSYIKISKTVDSLGKLEEQEALRIIDSLNGIINNLRTEKLEDSLETIRTAHVTASIAKNDHDSLQLIITKYINDNYTELTFFLQKLSGFSPEIIATLSPIAAQGATNAAQQQSLQVSYSYNIAPAPIATFRMPSESEMIDAVAIYIAKRIKQESVMWFFEQISKNATQYELLRTFFPSTIGLLNSNEIYEIPNMGMQWRYALAKDFVRMPQNVLTSDWMKDRFPEIVKYQSYIIGSCGIAEGLMNKMSYREIVADQYMQHITRVQKPDSIDFYDIIDLLHAVNTELCTPPDTMYRNGRLITYDEYRTLTGKEVEIMISLIDMKYNGLFKKFLNVKGGTLQFDNKLTPENIRLLLGRIENVTGEIEKTRKVLVNEIDNAKETTNNDYKAITYSTINVWGSVNNLLKVFDTTMQPPAMFSQAVIKSNQALNYTGQLFEVYNLITQKNYAGAVQNMIVMIDSLFYGTSVTGNTYEINMGKMKQVYEKFSTNKILDQIAIAAYAGTYEIDTLQKVYNFKYNKKTGAISFAKNSPIAAILFDRDRHSVQLVRKLAGFLNDAALAENSKELAKAIESYAMPPGSYKRKRNCWFSADVNAFAGPYYGYEFVPRIDEKWMKVYGFSVPIGLSFSKTVGRPYIRKRNEDDEKQVKTISRDYILNPDKLKIKDRRIYYRSKSTLTATLSIVDLGAVVSYRLQHGNDTALPQVLKWEQFISPGFHIGYGIAGTPLILQIGAQYTPRLRRLDATDTEEQYNAYRYYFGVFYDLPLINMWEKKRFKR